MAMSSRVCNRVCAVGVSAAVLLQPMAENEVTIEAWYMDESQSDQRLPHRQVLNVFEAAVAGPGISSCHTAQHTPYAWNLWHLCHNCKQDLQSGSRRVWLQHQPL